MFRVVSEFKAVSSWVFAEIMSVAECDGSCDFQCILAAHRVSSFGYSDPVVSVVHRGVQLAVATGVGFLAVATGVGFIESGLVSRSRLCGVLSVNRSVSCPVR